VTPWITVCFQANYTRYNHHVLNNVLIELRRVSSGELAEDELLAAIRTLDPHLYSDEEKDRQLAQRLYGWEWWNDASYALPKVRLESVVDAAKDFVLALVSLAFSSTLTIN
jgi:hypothetical protein